MYFGGTFVKMKYVSKRTMVLTEILLLGNTLFCPFFRFTGKQLKLKMEKGKKNIFIFCLHNSKSHFTNFHKRLQKTHTLFYRIELCCAKPQFV